MLNITGGPDLSLYEGQIASDIVGQAATNDVNIIFGTSINENLQDEIIVTVIATGIDKKEKAAKLMTNSQANLKKDPLSDWDLTRELSGERNVNQMKRDNDFKDIEKKDFNVFGTDFAQTNTDDNLDVPPFLRHRNK